MQSSRCPALNAGLLESWNTLIESMKTLCESILKVVESGSGSDSHTPAFGEQNALEICFICWEAFGH